MNNGQIKQVVFDLGGVILQWDPRAISLKIFPDPKDRKKLFSTVFNFGLWVKMDRGSLTQREAITEFSQATGLPEAQFRRLVLTAKRSLKLIPETVTVLHQLRDAGIPLYCLSNLPTEFYGYLRRKYDFWDVFDGVMISAQVKKTKPEPDIFHIFLDKYSLDPTETLFIDDREDNVTTASNLGFQTLHFKKSEMLKDYFAPMI